MDRDLILIFSFTFTILFLLSATAILWPFTRRLADALEHYMRGRSGEEQLHGEISRLRDVVYSMDQRLELLEDRLDFTESLVERAPREPARLEEGRGRPGPAPAVDSEGTSG